MSRAPLAYMKGSNIDRQRPCLARDKLENASADHSVDLRSLAEEKKKDPPQGIIEAILP